MPATDPLARFSAPTRDWFAGAFAAPTPAQVGAWESIAAGRHTLVIAPTGSGKTLSAFLWAIDRLATAAPGAKRAGRIETAAPGAKRAGRIETAAPGAKRAGRIDAAARTPRRTKVLYISPLKALAVDVERNLRSPLAGISAAARSAGADPPEITVGIRSGDTPAAARRQLVRTPPDILITTPESLYLMLTSSARETLADVDTVIVDEVHAVAGTKRGTHLALSLERLDAQLASPAQRIGLSATVRPPEAVAEFLGGAQPCHIVDPPAAKTFELRIDVPVEDMANIPPADDPLPGDDAFSPTAGSIWPAIERSIADEILANRATIVFANSRRLAERLTAALNEIHARDLGFGTEDADEVRNHRNPGGKPSAISTFDTPPVPLDAPVLARAHHGSVSKEQRAQIEDDLKSGRLRCVVATSSLELGIDMGAVDLVIQVESPPSVASGLQRVGRAGHQVGEISRGILYPKHRTDLIHTTVAAARMRDGLIERLTIPSNPLDVLAQQTIAAAAVADLDVDEWYETVRRAAPYRNLGRDVYEATLDLISGRFPSEEFAELRPRVTWDRVAGTLVGRRGALRLAVTSGGTIPDRGLFGVFLAGDEDGPRRVGELDEEMVYESRVGDVFALGASSWRIAEITPDRVLVTPAPGMPGRLPFWIGDAVGRPAELGAAIGEFTGAVANAKSVDDEVADLGLTEFARGNLTTLIDEQRDATGTVPTDRTLVVERFRDELGDWRVILHSPYGLRVHAPWASAISNRLKATLGLEGAVSAADDGIVVRLPDTDDEPPGPEVFLVDPDEIEAMVTDALADSPLFASRFRECAARALLLPRRDPGRRSPLWQQRQRSVQLLGVASRYPDFPIILEAVRECLQDVYDLPALQDLLTRIARRQIRLTAVETPSASPFAAALLFDYVGAFMYADDVPVAERRAAALSLDTALLAQLLGRLDLRELLDDEVIAEVVARLQRLDPTRQARDAQDIGDLLRWLGPLTTEEIALRYRGDEPVPAVLDSLRGQVIEITHRGRSLWAAVEDAGRLRDGLGVALPTGVPVAFTEPVADPVGDLVSRFARTHGPFSAAQAAENIGLPPAVVTDTLTRLASSRRVVEGEFVPAAPGESGSQWCHPDVLGQIRRGSLAATRSAIAPVDHASFARFLLDWQHIVVAGDTRRQGPQTRGTGAVATVIDQLAGVPIPASAWETLILPARVPDYSPSMLDELLSSGEVVWSGHGAIGSADGWVAFHPADLTPATLPPPDDVEMTATMVGIVGALESGGALRLPELINGLDAPGDVTDGMWALVWSGRVANDSFSPVRALLAGHGTAKKSAPSHRSRRPPRLRGARLSGAYLAGSAHPVAAPSVPPVLGGRWLLLNRVEVDPTAATSALCEVLLERYGVVTKGAVHVEGVPGGFSRVYRALTVFEDSGKVRRGYYVDGLGGAQFAVPTTVDGLRDHTTIPRERAGRAVVLAATDPANPYGAALDWPTTEAGAHRPGRKAGALVVLVDGELVCFVERGGKTVLTFASDGAPFDGAAAALADLVRSGRVERLAIDTVDGEPVLTTGFGKQLVAAGFSTTPRGIRMRYGQM
ncbi:ATP-dependent helicase [Gordonia sp. X0973]|uniref:ATP-dependent helicase n=1 Tax=Gordonia sp. X0973 TaxID=2742602 RepID=UPI00101CDBC3|nr:ATP-dependent helicase [Gordonia sp. X0973]QKT06748.1 ATP-dependent helicase [Gordonia sp. X0973]